MAPNTKHRRAMLQLLGMAVKEKMSKDKVKRREDTRKDLSRFTTDTQLELEREKMEFETRATEVSTPP